MRKLAVITIGVVLAVGVLGLSGQAQAATIITSPDQYFIIQNGTPTVLKMSNFESAYSTEWSADTSTWGTAAKDIGIGTYLRGIFKITNSQNGSGTEERVSDGSFQLTGEFSGVVTGFEDLGGGAGIFELSPDSAFETAHGTGAMVVFYNDSVVDFDGTGTLASSYASATGGSKYMVLGATGSWGTDYYWNAKGDITPGASSFTASLDLLSNFSGIADADFRALTQTPVAGSDPSLGAIENLFALQGITNVNSVEGSLWQLTSEDPLRAIVVPVPAASWLGAAMLFGLLGLRIRKSRRQAA